MTNHPTDHLDDNGEWHRDDGGPAVITPQTHEWFTHGQLHRDDGPAIENTTTGSTYWSLHDTGTNAETVVRAWLNRHHPDTPPNAADTLITLANHWTPGDNLAHLYTAALAAHQ